MPWVIWNTYSLLPNSVGAFSISQMSLLPHRYSYIWAIVICTFYFLLSLCNVHAHLNNELHGLADACEANRPPVGYENRQNCSLAYPDYYLWGEGVWSTDI